MVGNAYNTRVKQETGVHQQGQSCRRVSKRRGKFGKELIVHLEEIVIIVLLAHNRQEVSVSKLLFEKTVAHPAEIPLVVVLPLQGGLQHLHPTLQSESVHVTPDQVHTSTIINALEAVASRKAHLQPLQPPSRQVVEPADVMTLKFALRSFTPQNGDLRVIYSTQRGIGI